MDDKIKNTKLGVVIVSIYLTLVIMALVYFIVMITLYTMEAEFSGLYIVILTLPWSIIVVLLLDNFRMIDSITLTTKVLLFLGCAIPNAFILYWIGSKINVTKRIKEYCANIELLFLQNTSHHHYWS